MEANNSAFCWVTAPAIDKGAVVPAVGQGSGAKGIPLRAISIIAATLSDGKPSGLTGETLNENTSSGGPSTEAMRIAYCTSLEVCIPGPCSGLVVLGMAYRYIANDI